MAFEAEIAQAKQIAGNGLFSFIAGEVQTATQNAGIKLQNEIAPVKKQAAVADSVSMPSLGPNLQMMIIGAVVVLGGFLFLKRKKA